MPHRRLTCHFRPGLVLASALAAAACDKSASPDRMDTAASVAVPSLPAAAPPARATTWNPAAGTALLVQGETREEAIVVLPFEDDAPSVQRLRELARQQVPLTLLGRGGATLTGEFAVLPSDAESECRVWPVRLPATAGETASWAIGFVGGRVASLPLDSVDGLSSRDSMALAAEASRLASAVTAQTLPSFQGLRFAAHNVRRFRLSPETDALVAHAIRRVNQEANPQEEHTLLIAERDSGSAPGRYEVVYSERTQGLEEAVATPEVIAAITIDGRPALVIARDGEAGVAYAMIERTARGQWRVRWTSGVTRCG